MRMLDAFRRRLGNVHGVSYPEFGYYSPFYKEENLDTSSEDKNQFLRHHKTIVITGGASGLGKALAKKLLTYEWITVIILDIMSICPKEFSGTRETDPSSPTDHPDPTSQTPGRLLYFQCDVRDPLQLINAASCIIGQVGLPDVLVSNAGVESIGDFWSVTPDEILRVFQTNTFSIYYLLHAFLSPNGGRPGTDARPRCHVISIASCLGLGGVANVSLYCGSKFALVGILESLRQELNAMAVDKDAMTIKPQLYLTVVCPYQIEDTGMFCSKGFGDTLDASFLPPHKINPWIPSFVMPSLRPVDIVDALLLEMGKGWQGKTPRRELWMPLFVRALPLLRLLPTSCYDFCMSFTGANKSIRSSRPPAKLAQGPPSSESLQHANLSETRFIH